jgi:hypothetical protein
MIGEIFIYNILNYLKYCEYNFWKNIYNNIYLHEIIDNDFLPNITLSNIIEKNIELIYNNREIENVEYINYNQETIIENINKYNKLDESTINLLNEDYNKLDNLKKNLNKYLVLIKINTKNKLLENISVEINTKNLTECAIVDINKIKENTKTIKKYNYFIYNYDIKNNDNIINYNSRIQNNFICKIYNGIIKNLYNIFRKNLKILKKQFKRKKNHIKKYYHLYYNFLYLRNEILLNKNDYQIINKTNEKIKELIINNLFQWIVVQTLSFTISVTLLSSNLLNSSNKNINIVMNIFLLLSCTLNISSIYKLNCLYFFWNTIHPLQVILIMFKNSHYNCSIISTKIDFFWSCILLLSCVIISIFDDYSNNINIILFIIILIIYIISMFIFILYLETHYCKNSYQYSVLHIKKNYIENNQDIENTENNQDIENIENTENIKNTENIENTENNQDIENNIKIFGTE